jgi:Mn2+/Fe2+ NRAMP family transporter
MQQYACLRFRSEIFHIDEEFARILLRVALVGGTIITVGATMLVFAFRAFAPSEEKGRDFRAVLAIIAVLVVVMVGCVVLLLFSYSKR